MPDPAADLLGPLLDSLRRHAPKRHDPEGEPAMSITNAEDLARLFHETYERLAPEHGYRTREASAVAWDDVPADNKALMIATAGEVLRNWPPLPLTPQPLMAVDPPRMQVTVHADSPEAALLLAEKLATDKELKARAERAERMADILSRALDGLLARGAR